MRERAFRLAEEKTLFIRDTRGMSARIAKTIGLEPAAFSLYLRGERHMPESALMALCRATSKKPADFLFDASERYFLESTEIA